MSRIALLPSRGDPFTLMLTWYFFENVWQDEVDKLLINVNSPEEIEVVNFIKKYTAHPKVVFSYTDHPTDHGPALTKMFKESTGEIVVFVEDDSIIFKKGLVDQYCKSIEEKTTDCVGSLRWCCTGELIDRERVMFGLLDDKYLPGGNFWPCFFFARRSDLAKTNLHFAGKNWKAGEHIEAVHWITPVDIASDTFVWMSMQLRDLGLKFTEVEQYHGNSGDIGCYENKTFLFDGNCGWLHNGTLSSAIEDILTDDNDIPLARRKDSSAAKYQALTMPAEKEELERRLSWGLLAYRQFKDKFDDIAEFRDLYGKAIEKYINRFNLDRNRIDRSIKIYKELIGL